ncbi:MAG: pyridoxamine 5'-phosphate oxidase family protein [Gammaproteobacteria bacterium]|nr:pyridoxamine 5'-phosphate oxidase family protein [Gammaproteobacteria bacterium]MBU1407776.1 pyridoxamine 5'-phosphate oxidase family protein [Gammaproteobacteria bacterium]MBU1531889.1 pyridoxamine 5'-phosphate oxidase family protein [Gammaproteobacteria bacterium]
MNPAFAQTLHELLQTQQVAALGTLHQGQPYVSMVPFALLPGGSGFVIHVSQLAAHTKDMLSSPQVSLLVVAPPAPDVPVQGLARITVQGRAVQYANGTEGHAEAKAAYLARFPQSADLFSFADFSLFAIWPDSIRFVGGFAQATTLLPETLVEVLSAG